MLGMTANVGRVSCVKEHGKGRTNDHERRGEWRGYGIYPETLLVLGNAVLDKRFELGSNGVCGDDGGRVEKRDGNRTRFVFVLYCQICERWAKRRVDALKCQLLEVDTIHHTLAPLEEFELGERAR